MLKACPTMPAAICRQLPVTIQWPYVAGGCGFRTRAVCCRLMEFFVYAGNVKTAN